VSQPYTPRQAEDIDLTVGDHIIRLPKVCGIVNKTAVAGTLSARLLYDTKFHTYTVPAGATIPGQFYEVDKSGTTPADATSWAAWDDSD